MLKSVLKAVKIFFSISYKSYKNNSDKKSILYGCKDIDRYAIKDGKLFSPILASIQGYFDSDFEVVNITQSVSKFYSKEILNGHINLNFLLIIDIIVKPFFFIIGRRKKKSLKVSVYRKILLKNKVKLVVSIQPPHALCIAAHDLGIKVAEPMHGFNFSASDKIFLNQFDGVEDYLLPDYFIAFDDQTYQTLNIILKNRKVEVILMPHPWHCECLKTESALIDKSQLVSISKLNSDKVILLSLQWGYDGEREILNNIIPNGILHDSVIDVIKNHENIFWLIRLHPIQLKERFYHRHRKFIADLCAKYENTEFVDASIAPLPLLLKQVNGHLTMSSGSAGEAALMNIPSLMLCPTLREGGALCGSFDHPSIENLISFSEPTSSNIYNWISSLNEFSFSHSDNHVNSRKIREGLDYLEKKN